MDGTNTENTNRQTGRQGTPAQPPGTAQEPQDRQMPSGAPEAGKETSLDSFLADEANRQAYDAAVSAAVSAELSRRQAEADKAARLEKMTPEEKTAEKERELQEREAKLQEAELRSAAVIAFGRAGIPARLADCLNYSSKEAYEQSRDSSMAAFQEAVQEGVNGRLRGKTLPAAAGGRETARTDAADWLQDLIQESQVKKK